MNDTSSGLKISSRPYRIKNRQFGDSRIILRKLDRSYWRIVVHMEELSKQLSPPNFSVGFLGKRGERIYKALFLFVILKFAKLSLSCSNCIF